MEIIVITASKKHSITQILSKYSMADLIRSTGDCWRSGLLHIGQYKNKYKAIPSLIVSKITSIIVKVPMHQQIHFVALP